jgi:uncharacterized protein (TIGR03067 family)
MPLLVLVAAGFAPAPPPRTSNGKADVKKMQGTWVVVGFTSDGRPLHENGGWRCWALAGERMRLFRSERVASEGVWTLDATKRPRRWALKGRGWVCQGIYSLAGDDLKLCTDGDGLPPPKAFDGPNRGKLLWVLKRQKP